VFPKIQDSKSAVLVPPVETGSADGEYTLLWGAGTIHAARSADPLKWPADGGDVWLETRQAPGWDSKGVESGPPPLALSTGDLFFVYNAWDNAEVYRPGWVVLSRDDPRVIVQRSDTPFLAPTHDWDRGTAPYTCNVANVVFVEAMHATSAPDVFRIYFGGADAVIGTAVIRVTAY